MAYREVYRDYGQLSCGGTNPCLDGVPIGIADKYKPPARVLISSAVFEPRHVCDVLEDEYDFNLETSVLTKYATYVETEALKERAKIEQIGSTIEDFSRATAVDVSMENSMFDETDNSSGAKRLKNDNSCERLSGVSPGFLLKQNKTINANCVNDQDGSMPFVLPLSSTILEPTRIMPARRATPKEEAKAFRVRDFETVDDPFDDLELEVLDDMAELGKVLQVAQTQNATKSPRDNSCDALSSLVNGEPQNDSKTLVNDRHSPQQNIGIASPQHNIGIPAQSRVLPHSQISMNTHSSPPNVGIHVQDRASPKSQIFMNKQTVSFSSNNANAEPPPLVHPGPYSLQHPVSSVQNSYQSGVSTTDVPVLKHGAVANLSSRTDRFSLPNIHLPVVVSQNAPNHLPPIEAMQNNPDLSTMNSQSQPVYSQANNFDNFAKFGSYDRDSIPTIATQNNYNPYSRHSTMTTNVMDDTFTSQRMAQSFNATHSYGHSGPRIYTDCKNDDLSSPRPLSGLRSARSTPDISKLEDYSKASFPVSYSPPPRPSDQQTWNRYTPLPPSPNMRNSLSDTSRTSTPTSSDSPTGLADPFTKLSHEDQQLIISIADMGFPRSRVARAVQKLGQDSKQVVDHLCQVTRLEESGFSSEDAEASLHLFDNDPEKAQDYLELQSQFQELGFHHDKVREALVLHNNDRDKALDHLTA